MDTASAKSSEPPAKLTVESERSSIEQQSSFWSFTNFDERLLKGIILAAGLILGGTLVYIIFHYDSIPEHWKVAFTAFIILLPFSFFLQASLNVKAVKAELHIKIQDELRQFYVWLSILKTDENYGMDVIRSYPEDEVSKEERRIKQQEIKMKLQKQEEFERYVIEKGTEQEFRDAFENKAEELRKFGQVRLYSIYREAYQKYYHYVVEENKLTKEKIVDLRDNLLKYELTWLLEKIIDDRIKSESIDFRSYLAPLSFFLFIYFAGFLITVPVINSVFVTESSVVQIHLLKSVGIPLSIIQWGFLGGFVYTSLYMINRFLRKDLYPRVYLYGSFRLLLSVVVAVIIYFLYLIYPHTDHEIAPPSILLACFLAGVAPIQFLYRLADTQLSKITGWKRRNVAGNRPITLMGGVNYASAERLDEEGINSIQEMSLSDPDDLAIRTKFPESIVRDWRDQAILYILTGDIVVQEKTKDKKEEYLDERLHEKYGIRTIQDLLRMIRNEKILRDREREESFYKGLGIHSDGDKTYEWLHNLFISINNTALYMLSISKKKGIGLEIDRFTRAEIGEGSETTIRGNHIASDF
jgi:hypothetical protein